MKRAHSTPTKEAYTELQRAFDFFNTALFAGALPPCLITMQRKNRTYGYFCGDRWANQAGTVRDEIAMNPTHFVSRSVEEVLATLVHEMVHLWQHHEGKPSRSGYHNTEWADQMAAVGLVPTDTGKPGGKRTGQRVTHTIQEDGPFATACQKLLTKGFFLSWYDWAAEDAEGRARARKKANTRTKYTCPDCGVNAWARPNLVLICGGCQVALEANEETMGEAA
jgi:predicted SprT family Zn-dependent metalloprotease